MKLRGIMAMLFVLLLLAGASPSFACEDSFSDVPSSHWAYQEINNLAEKGVLSGYPDSTFKPEGKVSRAEFASMMVLALNIPAKKTESAFFRDVPRGHWAFKYVETSRYYLTGFRTASGDYFRPEGPAVREDMAVALVKALGYEDEPAEQDSQAFSDWSQISPNLRKYVAIAVKHGLMKGDYTEGGLRSFRPKETLKRAEAAVLLSKIKAGASGEEKVTYGREGTQIPDTPEPEEDKPVSNKAPRVSGEVSGDRVVLTWDPINDRNLQGYKVVISRQNPTPSYPGDGYLYWITDKSTTSAVVDNREPYKNGDFGKYLVPGESYYFSVTAVYGDRKVPGNVIYLAFP